MLLGVFSCSFASSALSISCVNKPKISGKKCVKREQTIFFYFKQPAAKAINFNFVLQTCTHTNTHQVYYYIHTHADVRTYQKPSPKGHDAIEMETFMTWKLVKLHCQTTEMSQKAINLKREIIIFPAYVTTLALMRRPSPPLRSISSLLC
jgi:hypothetical protein